MLKTLKNKTKSKSFKELSLPLQRRRIIKDAIAQIMQKKIKVKQGRYMQLLDKYGYVNNFQTGSLQKVLQEAKRPVCQVCAKGALFASCVLNVNKVDMSEDLDSGWFQKDKLSKWFTSAELDMIETAFEKDVMNDDENILQIFGGTVKKTELAKKCIAFGKRYKRPEDRLIAILENILKNKTFKP